MESNIADEKGFVEPAHWKDEHINVIHDYLEHQGNKFLERFNMFSYLVLLSMMDTHDIQHGYASFEEALSRITADVLQIGIDSDILFYTKEYNTMLVKYTVHTERLVRYMGMMHFLLNISN